MDVRKAGHGPSWAPVLVSTSGEQAMGLVPKGHSFQWGQVEEG